MFDNLPVDEAQNDDFLETHRLAVGGKGPHCPSCVPVMVNRTTTLSPSENHLLQLFVVVGKGDMGALHHPLNCVIAMP